MTIKFWTGLILFGLLGLVLGAVGISASTNPVSFFTILLVVLLIDLNANRS